MADRSKSIGRGRLRGLALLLALSSASVGAESLFVQSLKADLLEQPKFGAAAVKQLQKGDEVALLSAEGAWYKVNAGDKSGWVSRLLVAKHPPVERASILTGREDEAGREARRRASAVTTAGAARGLAAEQRRPEDKAPDYAALEAVERLDISQDEALRFLREGLQQ